MLQNSGFLFPPLFLNLITEILQLKRRFLGDIGQYTPVFLPGLGERGGEGKMYGKSNMGTYIIICKIDSQWEFDVWLKKLKKGLCINLEGWEGEEDGRELQKGGDICIPTADSCWGLTENSKIL